jgi:glycogen operon protein
VPWDRTVIYETHVRGMTMRHPEVPEAWRGTYAGLASEPILRHLRAIGVTTIQLMPVQQHIDDLFLREKGLSNYWGYQSLGYFAPHQSYAADSSPGAVIREFKEMVKAIHAAGLEVILDVVYNHTGEGGQGGASLVFRGLDNFIYYRLARHDRARFMDFTGTGNTIDMRHPRALQLVLDSLRYWVAEMHVDGFRFDLAATLGRESDDYDPQGGFFRAVRQDPVLSTVKLIAEPWDPGWGGYQLGNFPEPFVELNGRFRDDVRKFWKGDDGALPDLAARLTGSEDIFGDGRRRPQRTINFITCHDGFTLRDLVSYNGKHNLANGEDNRDGEGHNQSWNCGVEGGTSDPDILALRARQQRNLLATLFLSQGVPFLLGGDEISRTQGGNNNAYCQDNGVSWFDWDMKKARPDLRAFIRGLIDLRAREPVFRKRHFLHGNSLHGGASRDVLWLAPDGRAMTDAAWHDPGRKSLGMLLTGSARSSMSDWRRSRHSHTFLLLFHAGAADQKFVLPGEKVCHWHPVLDTCKEDPFVVGKYHALHGGTVSTLGAHSLRVYRLTAGSELQAQSFAVR